MGDETAKPPLNADGKLELEVFLHPSMQVPFKLPAEKAIFVMKPTDTVADLMDSTEELFEVESGNFGPSLELQISVLWNTKDYKKALNPNEKLELHFVTGEKFGVYGDIMPMAAPPKKEEAKIPVLILTGFLGSGKTTLLNYILQEQRDKKIAVIENEFGEVSIDDALLKQDKIALAEKIVVMDNGCMCCTIRGDLINGLKEIINEVKKGNALDCIAIETTGMADPVPIVRTFMSNPDITAELRLDGVVTVADAKHLIPRLDDDIEEGKVNEAFQQVAFADKIILNKLDLIDTDQAIVVKDRIRDINKFAKILPAVKSRIKLTELTNMRCHDMTHFAEIELDKEAEVDPSLEHGHGGHGGHGEHGGGHGHDENCDEDHGSGHGGGHGEHGGGHGGVHGGGHGGDHSGHGGGHGEAAGHGGGHGHGASRHDNRVNSFSIIREGEIVPQKLSQWMSALGQLPPDKGTIFRIKAILAVKGHPYKHVFHAVMDVSDEDDADAWKDGEKKISKIVFIGKAMDQKFLREGFEAIFDSA